MRALCGYACTRMSPLTRDHIFRRADLSANRRLPVFVDLVRSLQEAESHRDALAGFLTAMRRAYGSQGYVSVSVRDLNALQGEFRITQWSDEAAREFVDVRVDPWTGDGAPVARGGLLGELVRYPEPTLVRELELPEDSALGAWIGGYRSLMAVPLMDEGIVTNWAILLNPSPGAFDESDLEDFMLRASLIAQTVVSVRAANALRSATGWIEREIEQIAALQRAMLPHPMPEVPGATLAAEYRTYDKAGGDYYAVFPVLRDAASPASADATPTEWCLLVADASGHGPAAAALMAMVHAMLGMLASAGPTRDRAYASPAALLAFLNDQVCCHRIDGSFVTAFAVFYSPATHAIRYASAGHPPALVKTQGDGGNCDRLSGAAGLPLGVLPGVEYDWAEARLARGQTVVIYTDGITEAMSPPPPKPAPSAGGDVLESGWAAAELRGEMFGVRGIEHALEQCTGEPKCVIGSVFEAVKEHEAGLRPGDDQTVLALGVD